MWVWVWVWVCVREGGGGYVGVGVSVGVGVGVGGWVGGFRRSSGLKCFGMPPQLLEGLTLVGFLFVLESKETL